MMESPAASERTERLIEAINRLTDAINGAGPLITSLETIAEQMKTPSPGWRRMLDEFKGAVSRIPTTLRARF